MPTMLKCENCNQEYKRTKFTGKRFCCWECYNISRARVTRACEICGKEFLAKQYDIKMGRARFCSNSCRSKGRAGLVIGKDHPAWNRVEGVCEACDKSFEAKASRKDRRFCSRECYVRATRESGRRKRQRVEHCCAICGKPFFVSPSRSKKGQARTCSRKCQGEWQSRNRVGEVSPTWQGGKSFEPYPATFNARFKAMVRQRDNYTCAICGNWGNNVHHIDYNKANTTPENCITLCQTCHSKTNFNREYWKGTLTTR